MTAPEEAAKMDEWKCPVCLDLLYKPCVISCGHVLCFWCAAYFCLPPYVFKAVPPTGHLPFFSFETLLLVSQNQNLRYAVGTETILIFGFPVVLLQMIVARSSWSLTESY